MIMNPFCPKCFKEAVDVETENEFYVRCDEHGDFVMDYQESLVSCKDLNYLINLIKEKGQDFFNKNWTVIEGIITITKDIEFNVDSRFTKGIYTKYQLKTGDKYLLVRGESYHQRNSDKLLEIAHDDLEKVIDIIPIPFLEENNVEYKSKINLETFKWEYLK